MGLVSWLQAKDRQGGGRGIIPNILSKVIYDKFYAPALSEQDNITQNDIIQHALAMRAKTRTAQPVTQPTVVSATQSPSDPFAEYYSMPQFTHKNGAPVDQSIIRTVVGAAKNRAVPEKLAGAMARWESDWNADSTGGTKPPGYGLYQLTPPIKGESPYDMSKIKDPGYNADTALAMIASGLEDAKKLGFSGDKAVRHALRRYNGGPAYYSDRVGFGGKTVNENTRNYADQVMSYYGE